MAKGYSASAVPSGRGTAFSPSCGLAPPARMTARSRCIRALVASSILYHSMGIMESKHPTPGKVTEAETFRIGNIGEIYREDIEKLISIYKDFLAEHA